MSALETPTGLVRPPIVGLTSTDRPAGVSALAVSGSVVTVGANERSSQPVKPVGSPLLSSNCVLDCAVTFGSCQVFDSIVKVDAAPHEVGNVKNGFSSPLTLG